MMIKYLALLVVLVCPLRAAPVNDYGVAGDTQQRLSDIIEATERSLVQLNEIKQQAIEYQQIKSSYMANQQDKELLLRMVKAASRLQKKIELLNLDYAFSRDTLKELALFSQIANKKGVPRP